MKSTPLRDGIKVVFTANIINLLFNLLTNLLLPKHLTVTAYAQIKSYQLYTSYVGLLHLGYADGMFLYWGGKSLNRSNHMSLSVDIKTMRLFQIGVSLLLFFSTLFLHDAAFTACALVAVPINMISYFRYLLQATGEFQKYAKAMNISTIATSVCLLFLLLIKLFSEYYLYLLIYVLVNYGVWIYLEFVFQRSYGLISIGRSVPVSKAVFTRNICTGFFLMLGNFSSIILTGMDRWFIKALMDNVSFAQYSFAVSIEGLLNVIISPISITLYNFFCKEKNHFQITALRNIIIVFSAALISWAYPVKFILETILINYHDSISVIFCLFGAQLFYIVIKCVYVNLYKSQKRQKAYFQKIIFVLISGFLFNFLLYAIFPIKESFAIGTLLCGIEWYLFCIHDLKNIVPIGKEIFFLYIELILFLTTGFTFSPFIGCFIYIISSALLSALFFKKDLASLFQNMKQRPL